MPCTPRSRACSQTYSVTSCHEWSSRILQMSRSRMPGTILSALRRSVKSANGIQLFEGSRDIGQVCRPRIVNPCAARLVRIARRSSCSLDAKLRSRWGLARCKRSPKRPVKFTSRNAHNSSDKFLIIRNNSFEFVINPTNYK